MKIGKLLIQCHGAKDLFFVEAEGIKQTFLIDLSVMESAVSIGFFAITIGRLK